MNAYTKNELFVSGDIQVPETKTAFYALVELAGHVVASAIHS
jgi:hypothetical protein